MIVDKYTFKIKLIDFGFSVKIDKPIKQMIGSLYYVAPELINNSYHDHSKCDIWSFGVLFYTILCKTSPFLGKSTRIVLSEIVNFNFTGVSVKIYNLYH